MREGLRLVVALAKNKIVPVSNSSDLKVCFSWWVVNIAYKF